MKAAAFIIGGLALMAVGLFVDLPIEWKVWEDDGTDVSSYDAIPYVVIIGGAVLVYVGASQVWERLKDRREIRRSRESA